MQKCILIIAGRQKNRPDKVWYFRVPQINFQNEEFKTMSGILSAFGSHILEILEQISICFRAALPNKSNANLVSKKDSMRNNGVYDDIFIKLKSIVKNLIMHIFNRSMYLFLYPLMLNVNCPTSNFS